MPKVKITGLPQMKKGGTYKKSKSKNKFTNMYEGGGEVPIPIYNPEVPEVSVADLTKQAMGGLMYEDGGLTEPPIKSVKQQSDKTYVKSPNIININDAIKKGELIKSLNLPGKYTTVAVPDYESSFSGDSLRFYPGQTFLGKTPYIRDLGNLYGVSDAVPQSTIVDLVKRKAARVYQDTARVKANRNFMPYQKPDEHTDYYKKLGGRIKVGEGYVQNEPSDGFAYGGMYATSDSPVPQRTSGLMNYLGYAQGGTKLPTPILRARLEAHMSPKEANDYIANYADGGNTGTGILGNMTFNPQPWKYVAGGQLGPYPSPSYKTDLSEFKKGGIHIKPEKRGTFTAAATKHGMGVQEFARKVMANKENYSPAMVKKANFARNAAKWKHAYGGTQPDLPKFYPGGPFDPLQYNIDYSLGKARQYTTDTGNDMPYNVNYGEMTAPDVPIETYDKEYLGFPVNYNPSMEGFNMQPMRINNVGPTYEQQAGKLYNPTTNKYEDPKMELKPIDRGDIGSPRKKMNWYYPGQFLSQSLGELSYLGEQGKRYETAPEYTYTPELMSAREPIRAIDESGRLAAANLRTGSGGAGNIYLANMAGLGTNLARTKASTIEGQKAANLERINQARLMNLQAKQASDLQTAQNRAQALQNYYATIGSLGMKGAVTGKDIRAEEMDKYKWQYLPQMFKAMEKNPELYKLYMQGTTGKLG